MNCKMAHEHIVAAAYGELAAELTDELELHLATCALCSSEREQLLDLKLLDDVFPLVEPDANLVARSRIKLNDALDALPPRRWYRRAARRLASLTAHWLPACAFASLLLLVGAAAGSFGGYQFALHRAPHNALAIQSAAVQSPSALPVSLSAAQPVKLASTEIANISSLVRQPNSQTIEVTYNQLLPQRLQASLDDPATHHLLLQAARNSTSAAVRNNSVELLAAQCRAAASCQQSGIRDVLLAALRSDKNAAVREKALHGLEPYVAEDLQVRNAVLQALMNDSDARIRNAAINIVQPVEADTSVRQVLYSVSNTDQNPYIRTASRQVLSQVPEIQ